MTRNNPITQLKALKAQMQAQKRTEGTEITLEMMTEANRQKVDLLFTEKRIKEGKE